MDTRRYLESLGQELAVLKERVRQLLHDPHWQTDGEWKESVLRQVLRRHLPATVRVGRGFVVTAEDSSSQIDILIYDGASPVVFADGDLAFVTPDAVLGIIEVKASIDSYAYRKAATKLAANVELVRRTANIRVFSALMAYDLESGPASTYLDITAEVATTSNARMDFASLGESLFLKYWEEDPKAPQRLYYSWHAYNLPGLASGYFVHNVVHLVCPQSVTSNDEVWFPRTGKEPHCIGKETNRWTAG